MKHRLQKKANGSYLRSIHAMNHGTKYQSLMVCEWSRITLHRSSTLFRNQNISLNLFLLTDRVVEREMFFSFDVVMNTGGSVLSEDLCLALASPHTGRVVSSLVQPPGFKE